MIPLIPALALAFLSFVSSVFVILRIVIPILPPHPLSRRVAPSEFGLPNFRTLSQADKSHLWLASLDLLALVIFVWQVVNEYIGGPMDFNVAIDPASTARFWFATTIRQTCLLLVASLTLLHVRMGRSVSFGAKHWLIWVPTVLFTGIGIGLAVVLSGVGVTSLFLGLVAYSTTVAILTSVSFCCLVGTLVIIKRNLAALNERIDPWPPVQQVEEKPRPSFATEEIDALRDGASWITSNASSRHNSISAWSFTTHHTTVPSHNGHSSTRGHPAPSHPSVPPRSSFWFNPATPYDAQDPNIPPVPPLPSPYRSNSPFPALSDDPDPFRRDLPSSHLPRVRNGSQTSWLTSESGSQATLSQWSYPTTHHPEGVRHDASTPNLRADLLPSTSRSATPAMANAQVLGGYGFAPESIQAEKGLAALNLPSSSEIDITLHRIIGWLIMIWIPTGFSLPYFFCATPHTALPPVISILFILSVTLSSPLLALNILFRSPMPIPTGLFEVHSDLPTSTVRPSTATLPSYKFSHEYKRSGSVTVVEGRRSGDVWVAKGDAVDGKSKMSRAVGMLSPMPRLAVLPVDKYEMQDGEITPPLPMQLEETPSDIALQDTPHSQASAELGRIRKDSKASSYFSGGDESMRFASQIMIAQRHYSTMAQTVVVPASPERNSVDAGVMMSIATGAAPPKRHTNHLRARSVTSFSGPQTADSSQFNISPPPSFPLPPTPPSVRAARLAQLGHKKSFSSGFSFGAVDDMNEIDALTAGVLPLLVPGLKVGDDMKIREGRNWDFSPPVTLSKKNRHAKMSSEEFGALTDFSSPEVHSTPARRQVVPRPRKVSTHKKNHYSLPSLALGKDGVHTWKAELQSALQAKVLAPNAETGRRNTVWGGESITNTVAHLNVVQEEDEALSSAGSSIGAKLGRALSTRSLGLRADVPHNVTTARSSVATLNMVPPPSAASTVTLFDFEAGLDSGPQAHSTPHNSVSQKPTMQKETAPVPVPERVPSMARSSIVYVKSDEENATYPTNTNPTTTTSSSTTRFAQWSSRAVRPLIPSTNKLQRKLSNSVTSPTLAMKTDSPGGGLRPLSLLQARDTNTDVQDAGVVGSSTRPLTLGKKQKTKTTMAHDENANVLPSSVNRKLKPLQLARSETSKMRGILRKQEVLPDVVVRPPSTSEHTGFAYSFRE